MLIDKSKLLEKLAELKKKTQEEISPSTNETIGAYHLIQAIDKVTKIVNETEPYTGYWLGDDKDRNNVYCSKCMYQFKDYNLKMAWGIYERPPHCPNCGAETKEG